MDKNKSEIYLKKCPGLIENDLTMSGTLLNGLYNRCSVYAEVQEFLEGKQ